MMDKPLVSQDVVRKPCPDCPDGSIWTKDGPTTEWCPTCKGMAFIWVPREEEERHE